VDRETFSFDHSLHNLIKIQTHTNDTFYLSSILSTMQLSLFLLSAAALVNAATATAVTTTDPVQLGTADKYVILSKTGIDTVPTSDITGNIGVSPIAATAITGFSLVMHSEGQYSESSQITGQAHAASYGGSVQTALTTAVSDMELAYTNAAGRPNEEEERKNVGDGDISDVSGVSLLTPGVYTFDKDITFTGKVTFSGSETDVFIMQTTGSLKQAAGSEVILDGGVLAKNIFWQVAGQVKVGAGSLMKGIILVKTDALFMSGSSFEGRVLAQTACNIQSTTIIAPL
jgi:hypothetical protein